MLSTGLHFASESTRASISTPSSRSLESTSLESSVPRERRRRFPSSVNSAAYFPLKATIRMWAGIAQTPRRRAAARGSTCARVGRTCLDGAPSSRGLVEALRTLRVRSCLRPLLARETNVPLALMLVRMALRPISKTRSLWRLPFSSGFRVVPLVHIASPSPSMRIALRRKLVPAELWFRPRPDGRRNCPLWSRAHRRSAPACWRAPPRSA